MRFIELSVYLERLESTTLRNEMMEILSELLSKTEIDETSETVYLILGRLRPKYDTLEFNLADRMVVRALALSCGRKVSEVEEIYKKMGDLGEVVRRISESANQRISENLTISEVYEELTRIALDSGQGSQERKIEKLAKLIKQIDTQGAKYVVRIVLSKLRLGFSDKTILDAISYMNSGSKENRKELDELYQKAPDVGELARLVKARGIEGARDEVRLRIGRPVMPALAQRLPTATEMIKKMGKVIAEPKFDGQRVQIHYSRTSEQANKRTGESANQQRQDGLFGEEGDGAGWVRTFTRNLDENSLMFPELSTIGEQIVGDEVILDSEAVGYDPKTGEMLPFQMTITRKRKHGIEQAAKDVPLRFYVFDILFRDGEDLLALPLSKRREILKESIKKGEVLTMDESIVTEDPGELREYHKTQLGKGLEGVVVKKIDGKYVPGRQNFNWVKFKEEEGTKGKLSDTVDAVVMGYYVGKGKRQKFGLGAFLVGIRKSSKFKVQSSKFDDSEKILTIAKIGTGLTDEQFKELFIRMQNLKIKEQNSGYVVDKSLIPDVWVKPGVVVEVAADEITKSPTHSSGYALRFPRLVRFRDDKEVSEATSVEEFGEIANV